ncbi:hypothetical protein CR513_27628, partial [Mucuna pruriens]
MALLSANDDPHSPYFLHPTCIPDLILVSHPLTSDNYNIWKDLREWFRKQNGPIKSVEERSYHLYAGPKSVCQYFSHMKGIWEELNEFQPSCACTNVRSWILPLDPLPHIIKVLSLIIQDEKHQKLEQILEDDWQRAGTDMGVSYHILTFDGKRDFLTLIDDHTRFTWTFLIQHKNEASTSIQNPFTLIETQFHATIKVIRTDNTRELAIADFLWSKGTLHQFSCVECPQLWWKEITSIS